MNVSAGRGEKADITGFPPFWYPLSCPLSGLLKKRSREYKDTGLKSGGKTIPYLFLFK